MARSNDSLWKNVDALHRLARVERALVPGPGSDVTSRGLPPDAFPPFNGRDDFALHAVEAPMTLASGDFSDMFLLSPTTLAIVVADVAGKGVAAATVRSVARSVIRNLSPVCASPGTLLSRLDRILTDAELGAMFLTAFVAWYDTRTGLVRSANAGHPLPYRITAAGEIESFGEVTGPILGILGEEPYGDTEQTLEPGERLVLYTDGVTETENDDDEPFGALRLVNELTRSARAPLDELCCRVVDRVRRFECRKSDDISLVALERRGAVDPA